MLVETWCTRMNHLFEMCGGERLSLFAYSNAQLASIANSDEFEHARGLAGGAVRNRYDAVATLVPQLPSPKTCFACGLHRCGSLIAEPCLWHSAGELVHCILLLFARFVLVAF